VVKEVMEKTATIASKESKRGKENAVMPENQIK
jgi:hypothetical protein